jgi:hypothetical protein
MRFEFKDIRGPKGTLSAIASQELLLGIAAAAAEIGVKWDDLAAVMMFETAGTMSASVQNPVSKATGLIQITYDEARKLGFTLDKCAKMSEVEQLQKVVVPYLKPKKPKYGSVEDLYLCIFFPAARGHSDDFIIGARDSTAFDGKVYAQNKGFDKDNDGFVRVGEVLTTIRAIANSHGGRVFFVDEPPKSSGGGGWQGANNALVLIGITAWALRRFG